MYCIFFFFLLYISGCIKKTKCCPHYVLFEHLHHLFYYLGTSALCLCVYIYVYTYVYVCKIFPEPFEDKPHVSQPFSPKYISVHCLRMGIFLQNN